MPKLLAHPSGPLVNSVSKTPITPGLAPSCDANWPGSLPSGSGFVGGSKVAKPAGQLAREHSGGDASGNALKVGGAVAAVSQPNPSTPVPGTITALSGPVSALRIPLVTDSPLLTMLNVAPPSVDCHS